MATKHIYVISDLHLGGISAEEDPKGIGFQMCRPEDRQRLARFIHYISTNHPNEPTQLIINGDFIDFLAEERITGKPAKAPTNPGDTEAFTESQEHAVAKLKRVIKRTDMGAPEGERVFEALQAFLAKGHRLTILLGNHDIEMSFPKVRQALFHYLTNGAPRHIEFLFDGEAYVEGDLLIEHGNRYDGWNAVWYGDLRAYRSSMSRGEDLPDMTIQPGSRLVAEIMNPLKTDYRFIDLLKPENEAVIPILLALDPDRLVTTQNIFSAFRKYIEKEFIEPAPGRVPKKQALIAARRRASARPAGTPLPQDRLVDMGDDTVLQRSVAILEKAESDWSVKDERVPKKRAQIASRSVGWMDSLRSLWAILMQGGAPAEDRLIRLRDALIEHRQSIATTFDLVTEAPIYKKAAERLVKGRKVVIFGHTHLPKCIKLKGGGWYFNSGTWCPVIRLPEKFYSKSVSAKAVMPELEQFVKDLKANKTEPWCESRTTFVKVTMQDGQSHAALREFRATDVQPEELGNTDGH